MRRDTRRLGWWRGAYIDMAKIVEVRVSYGRTVNMGNYESFRYDVTIQTDLESDDNFDRVIDNMRIAAKRKVTEAIHLERQPEPKPKEPWEDIY